MDYPPDTILSVVFRGVPFEDEKYLIRFALTVSNDWMMYVDSSWESVSDEEVRNIFQNSVKLRLADVLDVEFGRG